MKRDRSREDMSWALTLANQGRDEYAIAQALKRRSEKYVAMFNERGRDVADAYAERTARNAVEFQRANPKILDRNAGMLRIVELREAADRLDWSAEPGARRALEAAFLVALRVGSVRFGLSIREHALVAGQSFQQIRTTRTRLDALGWLRRNRKDKNGRTSRFTLTRGSIPPTHSNHVGGNTFTHRGLRCECVAPLRVDVRMLRVTPQPAPFALQNRALAHDAFRDRDWFWYLLHRHNVPMDAALLDEWARIRGTAGALTADRELFEEHRRAFRGELRSRNGIQVVADVDLIEAIQEANA
jgi:hypothetical protein